MQHTEVTRFIINNEKRKKWTGQKSTNQTIYLQDKTKQSKSNPVKVPQNKNGVNKKMGYSKVIVAFSIRDKKKYGRWYWEVFYFIGEKEITVCIFITSIDHQK